MSAAQIPDPQQTVSTNWMEAVQFLLAVVLAVLPGLFIGAVASAIKIGHKPITKFQEMVRTAIVSTLAGGIAAAVVKPMFPNLGIGGFIFVVFVVSFAADTVLHLLPKLVPAILGSFLKSQTGIQIDAPETEKGRRGK